MGNYPARVDNHFLLGPHQGTTRADWSWIALNIDEDDKGQHQPIYFLNKILVVCV